MERLIKQIGEVIYKVYQKEKHEYKKESIGDLPPNTFFKAERYTSLILKQTISKDVKVYAKKLMLNL